VKRALTLGTAVLILACSKPSIAPSLLQPSDLSPASGFDSSEIVPTAALLDASTLDATKLTAFLESTPYGQPSFLAAYTSHGQSAVDSMVAAAQQYSLNPLLFLVRAEMDEGLVGTSVYPASNSSRVEFAFGCGCAATGDCDLAYEGFDVQVNCLGAALRDDLNALAAHGKTDGGWGAGIQQTTLDGVQVTPKDVSTAALYQYTPLVALMQPGGNWVFWNIWQMYANALSYKGPPGGGLSWIGDACAQNATCQFNGTAGTCATQFPGGLCTLSCTGSCPSETGKAGTFCADFGSQGGFCLAVCNPADPQCRSGYTCTGVKQTGDTSMSQNVCFPG
jgi:hypothetical protein